MTDKPTHSLSPRLQGVVIAIILGYFLILQGLNSRTSYWLLKDGQAGIAVVTKDIWGGHNSVGYRYEVNNREYTGKDERSWQDTDNHRAQVGQRAAVYFSASHPWLSRLNKPRVVVEGLPVILIALILEIFAIVTIVDPRSGWAFNLSPAKRKADSTRR